jgi:hypothetical protein
MASFGYPSTGPVEPVAGLDLSRLSVRDGRLAPVTCVSCGCRLERRDDGTWWHFAGGEGHDARGCSVPCIDRPHYDQAGLTRN